MKGYVIQRNDNTERYFKIIEVDDDGTPIIGDTPEFTAKYLTPTEQVLFNVVTKDERSEI